MMLFSFIELSLRSITCNNSLSERLFYLRTITSNLKLIEVYPTLFNVSLKFIQWPVSKVVSNFSECKFPLISVYVVCRDSYCER